MSRPIPSKSEGAYGEPKEIVDAVVEGVALRLEGWLYRLESRLDALSQELSQKGKGTVLPQLEDEDALCRQQSQAAPRENLQSFFAELDVHLKEEQRKASVVLEAVSPRALVDESSGRSGVELAPCLRGAAGGRSEMRMTPTASPPPQKPQENMDSPSGILKANPPSNRTRVFEVYNPVPASTGFERFWETWSNVKEPPRTGWVAHAVGSNTFDNVCLVVIIANAGLMVHSTNLLASTLSYDVPTADMVMEILFVLWYCFEVGLKLYVHRLYFFVNKDAGWNIFDFVLAVIAVSDLLLENLVNLQLTFLRVHRLAKIGKTLRVVKGVRFLAEIRLMLGCLVGCLVPLFWAACLLTLIIMVASMVFVQSMSNYLIENGGTIGDEIKSDITTSFGSVWTAMMALFQATTGGQDWGNLYTVVSYSGWMGSTVFMVYIVFFVFAVSNIVTSIFVDKAMRVATPDTESLRLQKRREDLLAAGELKKVIERLDLDRSGKITHDEFVKVMQDPECLGIFDLYELDIRDADHFFVMLSTQLGTPELDVDMFVEGCMKIKGAATSIDLQGLYFQTEGLLDLMRPLATKVDKLAKEFGI